MDRRVAAATAADISATMVAPGSEHVAGVSKPTRRIANPGDFLNETGFSPLAANLRR